MNTSHSQPAIPDPLVTSTSIKSTSAVKEARRLAESVERISKEASAKSAAARAFVATNPGVASTSNFSTASAASNERQPRLLTAVRFLCEYPPAQLQWLDKYLSNQHATIGGVLPLSGVQHLADLQGYSTRFVDSDQRMFVLAQQQHYAHAQNLAAVTAAATAAARSSVGAAKAHPASAKVADEPTGINATMSRESPASAKRKVPGSAQKGASKSSTVEQGVSAKRLRSVPQHKQVRKGLKPSAASSLARPSYVSPKANVCKSAASSSPRARYKSPARSKSFLERKSSEKEARIASAEAWLQEQAQMIDRLKQAAHARDQVRLDSSNAAKAPTQIEDIKQNLAEYDTKSSRLKSIDTASNETGGCGSSAKNGQRDNASSNDKGGNSSEQRKHSVSDAVC